jgi:hypothetical protein
MPAIAAECAKASTPDNHASPRISKGAHERRSEFASRR